MLSDPFWCRESHSPTPSHFFNARGTVHLEAGQRAMEPSWNGGKNMAMCASLEPIINKTQLQNFETRQYKMQQNNGPKIVSQKESEFSNFRQVEGKFNAEDFTVFTKKFLSSLVKCTHFPSPPWRGSGAARSIYTRPGQRSTCMWHSQKASTNETKCIWFGWSLIYIDLYTT